MDELDGRGRGSGGPDGLPIKDERTARDEERELEAESELRDLE
jgi:hypothetical protein